MSEPTEFEKKWPLPAAMREPTEGEKAYGDFRAAGKTWNTFAQYYPDAYTALAAAEAKRARRRDKMEWRGKA